MIYIKYLIYFWIASIIVVLLVDEYKNFASFYRKMDKDTARTVHLGISFLMLGSGFFGMLYSIHVSLSEIEVVLRLIIGFTLLIVGLKNFTKGVR